MVEKASEDVGDVGQALLVDTHWELKAFKLDLISFPLQPLPNPTGNNSLQVSIPVTPTTINLSCANHKFR